jgi:hypothetical protein
VISLAEAGSVRAEERISFPFDSDSEANHASFVGDGLWTTFESHILIGDLRVYHILQDFDCLRAPRRGCEDEGE